MVAMDVLQLINATIISNLLKTNLPKTMSNMLIVFLLIIKIINYKYEI